VRVPGAVTCRVLKFSRQGYCAWLADPVSDRDLQDAYLTHAALELHEGAPEFRVSAVARVLAPLGLRLSPAKTTVVHMSDGFDFLGFRIQWKRKRGTNKWYVYTFCGTSSNSPGLASSISPWGPVCRLVGGGLLGVG
jgi:hypothetical protein